MFAEWYKPGCSLEYPVGGSGAIVDALVRGLQKFGGRISLRSHVENIVVENGRAVGVKLRSGQVSNQDSYFIQEADTGQNRLDWFDPKNLFWSKFC